MCFPGETMLAFNSDQSGKLLIISPHSIRITIWLLTSKQGLSKHNLVPVQAKIFAFPSCHCFLLFYQPLKDLESVPAVPLCPQLQQVDK